MADLTLQDVRAKFPQYADMSDDQLVNGLHQKFYSDVPQADFYKKVGYTPAAPKPAEAEQPGIVSRNPVVGGAELLAHHITGMLSAIPGMVAGAGASVGKLAGADVDPNKVQADTEKMFTYQPMSASGKAGLEQEGKIGAAVAPVVKPVTDTIDAGLAKTGAAEPYIRAAGKGALTAAALTPVGKLAETAGLAAAAPKALDLSAVPVEDAVAFRGRAPVVGEAPNPITSPQAAADRRALAPNLGKVEPVTADSGKVTGGSAIENGRGMGFKFAPSDVASRAPADALEGGVPGLKREGIAGSPETRKEATLHNTATATKEAGKFLGAGDDVRALTPQHFADAEAPHIGVYEDTGKAIGTGKTGSGEFKQALADALADQRPQTALSPKVARVVQQNIARAESGNLAGPQMVKDISFLRANGGRGVSRAFEDEMERQLAGTGAKSAPTPGDEYIPGGGTLSNQLQAFKDARQGIAQVRTLQDATTGGQINLQALAKEHENTNGKVFTGPLKVMAEAAAAAPGSMRLPLGGVGSTVKGKTLFEAGKNAASKVAQKVVPGLNPLSDQVQNQLGRVAGDTGRSYLKDAGKRVKPTEALELKNAPGRVGELMADQSKMDLPQGPGPREQLELAPPEGIAYEPAQIPAMQRALDLESLSPVAMDHNIGSKMGGKKRRGKD